MKKMLFNIVASIGGGFLWLANESSDLLCYGIDAVSDLIVWIISNTFKSILWMIDRERVDHAEQVMDQYIINRELEILSAVSEVKENALDRKFWSEKHSTALSILGNRLLNECEWEEDRIHDYMRRVVESIPGLGYAVGSDDEEEEGGTFIDS